MGGNIQIGGQHRTGSQGNSSPIPRTIIYVQQYVCRSRALKNSELDLVVVLDIVLVGVFVQGITERGPVNDPSKLVYCWPQFEQLFGGLIPESDFPLHCKLLLERGCVLRVNSIKNAPILSTAIVSNDETTPDELFTLQSKYPGLSYNDLDVKFSDPSDSTLGDFNMAIYFGDDLMESYENLTISELTLNQALANSKWVELESIEDLTAITNKVPATGTVAFIGGSDGSLVSDNELSDFSAFDDYDESFFLLAPGDATTAVHVAGEAYAAQRQDLRYYASLVSDDDSSVIITEREALPYSKYVSYTSGGWRVFDPLIGASKNIAEVSLFVANAINTFANEAPWYSFSGPANPVSGVFGPVVNYGTKGRFAELDQLNRNHINMAINRNGINMFWGNFTAQRENTHTKFISTHNLILYMGRTLVPTLETFIEKPLDLPLFRTIHETVKPYLDGLVSGRAIFEYAWLGDQNATSIESLKINDPVDVQMGKYKVRLPIKRVNPLQEFELIIELTRAGVNLE